MAVYTDDFNRASLGANWSLPPGEDQVPHIVSNQLAAVTDDYEAAYYSAGTFNADHYSQAKITTLVDIDFELLVRVDPGTADLACHMMEVIGDGSGNVVIYIGRFDGIGGLTWPLADLVDRPNLGDTYKLGVSGSTLYLFRNGELLFTWTDPDPLTGGYPGVGAAAAATTMDDWEGGDFAEPDSIIFADNFNRANEAPLSQGGHWATGGGYANGCRLVSNRAVAGATTPCGSYRTESYGDDQWSQATIAAMPNHELHFCIRSQGAAGAGRYALVIDPDGSWYAAIKRGDASWGDFADENYISPPAIEAGDVVKISAVGSLVSVYINGALCFTGTDTEWASGCPSIAFMSGETACALDDWSGGSPPAANTVSGSGSTSVVAAATGAGRKEGKGSGAFSVIATLAAVGLAAMLGVGSVTAVAKATGTGAKHALGAGAASAETAMSSAGIKQGVGFGSTAWEASALASGVKVGGGIGSASAEAAAQGTGRKSSYGAGVTAPEAVVSGTGIKSTGGPGSVSAIVQAAGFGTASENESHTGTGSVAIVGSTAGAGTKSALDAGVTAPEVVVSGTGNKSTDGSGSISAIIQFAGSGTAGENESGAGAGSAAIVGSTAGEGTKHALGSGVTAPEVVVSENGTVAVAGIPGVRKVILVHGGGTVASEGRKGAKVAAHLPGGGALVLTYTRTGGSIHYAYLPGGGAVVGQGLKEARSPPAVYGGGEILAAGVRFYTDVAVRAPAKYEPVRLVYLHLDYCGNVFGTSPCLATGTPCFNTWKTCKYLSAFDNVGKTYKYSEVDAALPFKGVRPYVKSVRLLPTEIKTNLTVNARVSVTMVDEMDRDIDTDPYLTAKGFGV